MSDTVFFLSSLGVWLVLSILFVVYRIKSGSPKNFLFFLLVNVILFAASAYTWFFHIATDGVSQVNGALLYGAIAVVLIGIETFVCHRKNR